MKLPLVILAVCSTIAGFVPFSKFITFNGTPLETHLNLVFSIAPVALSVLAILFAAKLYKKESNVPAKIARSLGSVYTAVTSKFYIDELYLFVTKRIIFNFVGRPAAWIDRNIIDGAMNGLALVTGATSNIIKAAQSGKVQSYALYFFAGVAGLAILFIYVWK